jgi:hypothetical protein
VAGAGHLTGTAQACLTADPKGKVQKSKGETLANDTSACTAPDSGYTGAATVNGRAWGGRAD